MNSLQPAPFFAVPGRTGPPAVPKAPLAPPNKAFLSSDGSWVDAVPTTVVPGVMIGDPHPKMPPVLYPKAAGTSTTAAACPPLPVHSAQRETTTRPPLSLPLQPLLSGMAVPERAMPLRPAGPWHRRFDKPAQCVGTLGSGIATGIATLNMAGLVQPAASGGVSGENAAAKMTTADKLAQHLKKKKMECSVGIAQSGAGNNKGKALSAGPPKPNLDGISLKKKEAGAGGGGKQETDATSFDNAVSCEKIESTSGPMAAAAATASVVRSAGAVTKKALSLPPPKHTDTTQSETAAPPRTDAAQEQAKAKEQDAAGDKVRSAFLAQREKVVEKVQKMSARKPPVVVDHRKLYKEVVPKPAPCAGIKHPTYGRAVTVAKALSRDDHDGGSRPDDETEVDVASKPPTEQGDLDVAVVDGAIEGTTTTHMQEGSQTPTTGEGSLKLTEMPTETTARTSSSVAAIVSESDIPVLTPNLLELGMPELPHDEKERPPPSEVQNPWTSASAPVNDVVAQKLNTVSAMAKPKPKAKPAARKEVSLGSSIGAGGPKIFELSDSGGGDSSGLLEPGRAPKVRRVEAMRKSEEQSSEDEGGDNSDPDARLARVMEKREQEINEEKDREVPIADAVVAQLPLDKLFLDYREKKDADKKTADLNSRRNNYPHHADAPVVLPAPVGKAPPPAPRGVTVIATSKSNAIAHPDQPLADRSVSYASIGQQLVAMRDSLSELNSLVTELDKNERRGVVSTTTTTSAVAVEGGGTPSPPGSSASGSPAGSSPVSLAKPVMNLLESETKVLTLFFRLIDKKILGNGMVEKYVPFGTAEKERKRERLKGVRRGFSNHLAVEPPGVGGGAGGGNKLFVGKKLATGEDVQNRRGGQPTNNTHQREEAEAPKTILLPADVVALLGEVEGDLRRGGEEKGEKGEESVIMGRGAGAADGVTVTPSSNRSTSTCCSSAGSPDAETLGPELKVSDAGGPIILTGKGQTQEPSKAGNDKTSEKVKGDLVDFEELCAAAKHQMQNSDRLIHRSKELRRKREMRERLKRKENVGGDSTVTSVSKVGGL